MSDESPSPRLEEFQEYVDDLKVTGGRANPERTMLTLCVVGFVASVVVIVAAFVESSGANDPRDQTDMVILAVLAAVVGVGSAIGFLRYSLTRWFRYWLIRLIFEQRAQADRIVGSDD